MIQKFSAPKINFDQLILIFLMIVMSFASQAKTNIKLENNFNFLSPFDISDRCRLELPSPMFKSALNNLYSFFYVRHGFRSALASLKKPETCLSMVSLSRNSYLYYQYLVRIDLFEDENLVPSFTFQFIFQDASVQAFHNVGGQPWVGLDQSSLVEISNNLIHNSKFKESFTSLASFQENPYTASLELVKNSPYFILQNSSRDDLTVSVTKLSTSQADPIELFLVTWMSKSDRNSSSEQVQLNGTIVKYDKSKSQILILEKSDLNTQVVRPIDIVKDKIFSNFNSHTDWTQELLKISNP